MAVPPFFVRFPSHLFLGGACPIPAPVPKPPSPFHPPIPPPGSVFFLSLSSAQIASLYTPRFSTCPPPPWATPVKLQPVPFFPAPPGLNRFLFSRNPFGMVPVPFSLRSPFPPLPSILRRLAGGDRAVALPFGTLLSLFPGPPVDCGPLKIVSRFL